MRVAYIHMLIPIVLNIFSYLETDKFSICNTQHDSNFLIIITTSNYLSYNIALLHLVPLDSVSLTFIIKCLNLLSEISIYHTYSSNSFFVIYRRYMQS